MASPYQYPWVNFFSTLTSSIDSTALIIYGAATNSIVDSIFVCNTTNQDIFIDVTILGERNVSRVQQVDTTTTGTEAATKAVDSAITGGTVGLVERSLVATTVYRVKNYLIPKNGSAELISLNQVDSVLILQAGDLLYANSDFSGNTFDSIVSGRQLLEEAS